MRSQFLPSAMPLKWTGAAVIRARFPNLSRGLHRALLREKAGRSSASVVKRTQWADDSGVKTCIASAGAAGSDDRRIVGAGDGQLISVRARQSRRPPDSPLGERTAAVSERAPRDGLMCVAEDHVRWNGHADAMLA